jgi:dTDP-4-amino-4,6-dideoxygalactose transaminase
MTHRGPRILLLGGSYRALCVLEHLLERGERVVAFVGQEGGAERDFCSEILEICDRTGVPARSGRKLGEEMVRWLEDRIRPELTIAVGLTADIPLAIGGNCRLGLLELDQEGRDAEPGAIVLRQRGQVIAERALVGSTEGDPEEAMLEAVDVTLAALDDYLNRLGSGPGEPEVRVPFGPRSGEPDAVDQMLEHPEPGDQTDALERELAAWVGADAAFALVSTEQAFRHAFRALGLGAGDEVLCPALASGAALRALRSLELRPVWVDVDPAQLTIDPARAADAVTPNTRALLVTHAFGQPAELDELYALAERHDLELVEDGASALGARVGESRLGRSPCLAVFTLPVQPGFGGRVPLVSVPDALVDRFAELAGAARCGDGTAQLGRRLLEAWEDRLAARRRNAGIYSSELVRYDAFQVPATPEGALPAYAQYLLRLTRFARTSADDLHKLLNEAGIESRRLALELGERELVRLPTTEGVLSQGLMLPVEAGLDESQLEHVLESIYDYAIG